MSNDYKVVALDLDGTLTNGKKEITEVTRRAIDKARAMGVKIVLASGRPHIGIRTVAEALDVEHEGGYILSYNGGQITDCITGEVIYRKRIDSDCFRDICETIRKFENIYPLTYDDDSVISENIEHKYVQREGFNCSLPLKRVENLYEAVKGREVVKFEIVGEHQDLEPVREYLQKRFPFQLSVYYSEPYFLEVVAPNIAKDKSLAVLLSKLGYTKEQLMACGDGLNDLPMLEYAGLAVAMENGCREAKLVSDFVTKTNEEDGVAYAFEKFIFN